MKITCKTVKKFTIEGYSTEFSSELEARESALFLRTKNLLTSYFRPDQISNNCVNINTLAKYLLDNSEDFRKSFGLISLSKNRLKKVKNK